MPEQNRRLKGVLAGIVLAQALLLVVVAKMATARYMVPAAGLMGVSVAALWVHAGRLPRRSAWAARGLLLGMVAAGLMIQGRAALVSQHAREGRAVIRRQAVEALEALGPEARIITVYGTSGEGAALNFAVYWAGNRYGDEVRRLHPRVLTGGLPNLYGYGSAHLTNADLRPLAREGRLYAMLPGRASLTGLRLEPIEQFGYERLYRVLPW